MAMATAGEARGGDSAEKTAAACTGKRRGRGEEGAHRCNNDDGKEETAMARVEEGGGLAASDDVLWRDKPSPTPYDVSMLLHKNKKQTRNQLEYSKIIGSLMYLASGTRPDISFAVSKLSRFTSNPRDGHWQALERVMRYLKATMDLGLRYSGYPMVLEGYSDSNWISDADEIKATSGYVFTLGGGAVSWRSCKQTILTRSAMEAELTALDTATC
uniref:Reverse transcriptase Ty1/copia-type domain-containing protein n=1 Tax=Oryza brachyantha TaxID=4533 RepID=J3KUY7_ORYBR